MTIPHVPFYFMRHGETDWNIQGISMGSQDIPLNPNGIKQAELVSRTLENLPITHIITSPLQRAVKTAQIVAKKLNIPITVVDNFKECSWGIYEGKPVAYNTVIKNWIEGALLEGAEPARTFEKRILIGLMEALHMPGPILIVSHGGVHFAIQRLLSLPPMDVENCSPLYHTPPERESHPWAVDKLRGRENKV